MRRIIGSGPTTRHAPVSESVPVCGSGGFTDLRGLRYWP
jgi:hypothetical protein